MYILGISAYYHDSAAAIIKDDEILAAVQEERFTRKKHDPSFPSHAVRYCLTHEGIAIDELDAVVFYDKPFLKFERLLETYYAFAPRGVKSFISTIPVWIKEKLMLKKLITDELLSIGDFDKKKLKLLFPEHHLSHAGSAFFPSPFEESAILTIDGVGEWATASICHGKGNRIRILKELGEDHINVFASMTLNSSNRDSFTGWFLQVGIVPQELTEFKPRETITNAGTSIVSDQRAESSVFWLSGMPGLSFNVGSSQRILVGLRLMYDLSGGSMEPGMLMSPMVQFDMSF